MKWFKLEKERTDRKSAEIYKDMIDESEKLIDSCLKASGTNLMEMLEDLDEENGALLGSLMTSYKKVMNLCVEQAMVIDRMESKLNSIDEWNKKAYSDICEKLYKLEKAKA